MSSIKWIRACAVPGIGFTREQRDAGWPTELNLECIAKLQYAESPKDERVFLSAIQADCQNGTIAHTTKTELSYPPVSSMSPLELMRMTLSNSEYEASVHYVKAIDLVVWLKSQGESPSTHLTAWFQNTSQPISVSKKHEFKQRLQEDRILEILKQSGYSALNLPPRPIGRSGVKAEVSKIALVDKGMFSASSFKHAWERLLSDKHLIEDK